MAILDSLNTNNLFCQFLEKIKAKKVRKLYLICEKKYERIVDQL